MEFQVTFLTIAKTDLPNAFIEANIETRNMSLSEIEAYIESFPTQWARAPMDRLATFHAESLRLINWGIRLANSVWERMVYSKLQRGDEVSPGVIGFLNEKFADLQNQIVEQNQYTMIIECIRPYKKRIARRRG